MMPRRKSKDRPVEDCIKTPNVSDLFGIFKKKDDTYCSVPDLQYSTDALQKAAVDYVKGKIFGN